MSTPTAFTAEPMPAHMCPPPVPPRYAKTQIYTDPQIFKPIDKHAVDEAKTNYRNFRDLIYNLAYRKNFNQLEKARAVFRWMTEKNMYTIMFDSELPGTPEQVLGGFKDGKTTYAKIFECLCSYAGLHCVTISGWAKGVDYRPGYPITSGAFNHSWNAVFVDGNWQLVDSHWATRYLQSERNTPENLVYQYDDFYFMTEPYQLVYSHCPEDIAWQLCHPAKSRSEYEEFPLVKSFFFSVGMKFLQQNCGVVYTKNGLITLTLGYTEPAAFTYKLTFGEGMMESLAGIPLKRYIIQETTDNRVTFYLRAPREGMYYLTLFAQRVGTYIKIENIFKAACEYKIICDQAASDARPYPLCNDSNWGPGAPVQQYGLTPSHKTAILPVPTGTANISFKKSRDVRLYARLNREGMDPDLLERSVNVREQDDMVYISSQLPTHGEYGLEIYANEPLKEGDTFTHICQYLCSYLERDFRAQYGQVYDRADLAFANQSTPLSYGGGEGQHGSMGRGGTMTAPGASGARAYAREEPDLAAYTQQLRQDEEARRKASQPDVQQMSGRMDSMTIGSKMQDSPSTNRNRSTTEDFPPPPPDLLDQATHQQRNKAEESHYPPIEISYVTTPNNTLNKQRTSQGIATPTNTLNKQNTSQENVGVAVSYVPSPTPQRKDYGGADDSPSSATSSLRKKPPGTLPKPGKKKLAEKRGLGASSSSSSEENVKGSHERLVTNESTLQASAQVTQGMDEDFPPPPPPPDASHDQRTRYQPGQQQTGFTQDSYQPKSGANTYQERYPFGRNTQQTGVTIEPQRPTEPEKEYKPHPTQMYTTSITVKAPENFAPKPITEKEEDAPQPLPPVVPPKPFKDTRIFENVDTHAVEVSKEEHKSFRDLVWHLIYAREITNELEKARAIFLWLCSKDLTKLTFTNVQRGSPEEILLNLKEGKTTYAVVYETLCSYAGLHCKTVSGYAKGAEYKPGMKFTSDQGQHSWNGVLVEGAWRLVDCHWAARRLVGKKVTADNVRYELDEYYFMPDPHQLIFTHFPDDPNWQLLDRPIALADFEHLVPVKSAFFKYGLQILSHRQAVIHTETEITVRIACPDAQSDTLAFTFTLTYEDGAEDYRGTKLSRYGMQEMVDNVSFFTIRPPERAQYRLIIYAKDLKHETKEGVYGGVCEYELVCEATQQTSKAFPPCVHTSWGPGDSIGKYNLTPLQKGAIFSTVQGQAEVRFTVPTELRFTAKLKSNEIEEKNLQGYIMYRVVGETAMFTIYAPAQGEYGLEIYANDPEKDGNSLYHAYQYLIICLESMPPVEALPLLPPGYLGPQPTCSKLGLVAASHVDPFVQCTQGEELVSFNLAQPLRMTSQLIYVSKGRNDDCSDYILQQSKEGQVIFHLRFPKTGMYKFQLYGLPYSDSSESLPGVYNYLINCTATPMAPVGFPKQYGQWKEGCYLHGPQEGHLAPSISHPSGSSSQESLHFKIDVPKSNAVAVVVGEEWTQLDQADSATWEGDVPMSSQWGRESKVAVCANFGTVKASYSTLLEYSM